jgi:hypothetical protein
MWATGIDLITYIEHNLKIKLDTKFNDETDEWEITAKLLLDNKVISEDKISFDV